MNVASPVTPDEQAFLAYLQSRALRRRGRVLSEGTASTIRRHLRMVMLRLDAGQTLRDVVTNRAVADEVMARLGADLAPGTVKNTMATLVRFGEWLRDTGQAEGLVLSADDVPRSQMKRRTNIYSDDDVELLLIAAGMVNERTLLLVLTLADCGLRIGEALGLRWDDVHLDHAPVPRYTIRETKTGVPRVVPMTPRLAEAWASADLAALRSNYRPEMARDGSRRSRTWKRDAGAHPFPMSYSATSVLMRGLADDAQVPWHGVHALRHHYATALLSRGVDVLAVSRLLGHASIAITASTYAHTQPMTYASVLGWE